MRTHTRRAPRCPSGRTPFYRKIGGLHFFRLGRLQFSFCVCRAIPAKVTANAGHSRADVMMAHIRRHNAERVAVQHQFGPF